MSDMAALCSAESLGGAPAARRRAVSLHLTLHHFCWAPVSGPPHHWQATVYSESTRSCTWRRT